METKMIINGQSVLVSLIDYKQRTFDHEFFAMRNDHGTGWLVYGRSLEEYKPSGIIKEVCRPDKPMRRMPLYNGLAHVGFRTKKDAEAAAVELSNKFASNA